MHNRKAAGMSFKLCVADSRKGCVCEQCSAFTFLVFFSPLFF